MHVHLLCYNIISDKKCILPDTLIYIIMDCTCLCQKMVLIMNWSYIVTLSFAVIGQ